MVYTKLKQMKRTRTKMEIRLGLKIAMFGLQNPRSEYGLNKAQAGRRGSERNFGTRAKQNGRLHDSKSDRGKRPRLKRDDHSDAVNLTCSVLGWFYHRIPKEVLSLLMFYCHSRDFLVEKTGIIRR